MTTIAVAPAKMALAAAKQDPSLSESGNFVDSCSASGEAKKKGANVFFPSL